MVRLSTAEIAEPLPYPCPHCRVELEVRDDDGWSGWRRCPACDLPLLPPERARHALAPWQSVGPTREEILRDNAAASVLVIEPSPEVAPPSSPWNPQHFEPFGRARRSRRDAWVRKGLSTGLGLSILGVLVTFLLQYNLALGCFCLISLIFFLLLMRPARKD